MTFIARLAFAVLVVACPAAGQAPGFAFQPAHVHSLGIPDHVGLSRLVDLDGDGRLDWIAREGVGIAEPSGAFTVRAPGVDTPFADGGRDGVADLDGDGDRDVFSLHRVSLNDGTGSFTELVGALPSFPVSPCGVVPVFDLPVLADFDGDGDVDVFLPTESGCGAAPAGNLHFLRNDGSGVFTLDPSAVPPLILDATFSHGDDLDGDGDVDVLLTTGAVTMVFDNDGTGTFVAVTPPGSGLGALRGASGDFDGDGLADVFLHQVTGDEMLFRTPTGFLLPFINPSVPALWLEAVDLDLDGADEVIRVNVDGLSVLPVAPSGLLGAPIARAFYSTSRPDPSSSLPVIIGDLDLDGDRDLVTVAEGRTRVFAGNGQGGLEEITRYDHPSALVIPGAAGDFDGDGDIDLVVREPLPGGGDRIGTMMNDGFGRFAVDPATWINLPTSTGDVGHVFDANGDSSPDLYIAAGRGSTRPDHVLVNIGVGWLHVATLTANGETTRVVDADVDGDGDRDIILGRGSIFDFPVGRQDLVVVNLGGAAFAPPRPLSATSVCTADIDAGDVDGDGDVDVVATCFFNTPQLLLNDGSGTFTAGSAFAIPFYSSNDAATLADLDGDGDLDAAIGGQLWSNDGAGNFALVASLQTGATPTPHEAVDHDDDGDLDLIETGGWLHTNHGGFNFTATPIFAGGTYDVPYPVLVDVDRDGDLDVLFDGAVLSNTARQVQSRGLRRVGETLHVDVFSLDPGWFWLLASFGTADLPIPPFGSLFLDPATAILVADGPVTSNFASTPIAIPAIPAIVGLDIHWQALVACGSTTSFGNLHTVTLRP